MGNKATDWVAKKLEENKELAIVQRTPEDFLIVRSQENHEFLVSVLSVQNEQSDVEPLFAGATKPQFIVNVPSKTLWSGAAICRIHAAAAAFGTLGEVSRAATTGDVGSYRNKNMGFFINAMKQHSNVSSVSYVYENVFQADRKSGPSLIVAVIDAYNMSAEDVRNAKNRFDQFDIVVKASSYGSITHQANAAAKSMGAEALTYSELMRRLAK
jgi:hypothetical protein